MTLSKKYLSMAALALLCAAVFSSCKGDGKKDQPTPPPAEEKSLIASLNITVKHLNPKKVDKATEYINTKYTYDKEGRVSSMTISEDGQGGLFSETWSITYGEGTMTISDHSDEVYVFQINSSGYVVGQKTDESNNFIAVASYDEEGHLQSIMDEQHTFETYVWDGDLITEMTKSYAVTSHETITYSNIKDPSSLMFLYIDNLNSIPYPGIWFGKWPTYLPSRIVRTYNMPITNEAVEGTTTYDYTLDAKGRPTKIFVTETSYEYDQYKGKNPLPDSKDVFTIEITYK